MSLFNYFSRKLVQYSSSWILLSCLVDDNKSHCIRIVLLLRGRQPSDRPQYGSCPSVRASVLYVFLTRKLKELKDKNQNWCWRSTGIFGQFLPVHALAMERSCRRLTSVRPSVRPSVTLMDADHIRWARWNFITPQLAQCLRSACANFQRSSAKGTFSN